MKKTVHLPAQMEAVEGELAALRRFMEKRGLPVALRHQMELALEEALVNVVLYAYQDGLGEIELTYDFTSPHEALFIISDVGVPFNPLEHRRVIPSDLSLEEREVGGLGIPFIFKNMDRVDYQRDGLFNILTLTKRF